MEACGRRWSGWAVGVAAVLVLAPAVASAWPCSVTIAKTVAADDDCDGTADGDFVESVTQEYDQCVVYRICVTNPVTASGATYASDNLLGVTVSDEHLGATLNFGDISGGQAPAAATTVCKYIPFSPATACRADPARCVCEDVEGVNTAVIDTATCQYSHGFACDHRDQPELPVPVCEDSATVTCERMEEGCLTRTPGYWGTHPTITQDVLDDMTVTSCGLTLTETEAEVQASATEDICSVGTDWRAYGSPQEAQLVRQCAAAALNIAVSADLGFECTALSEARFDQCCGSAEACAAVPSGCIEDLDRFNNSRDTITREGSELNLCHELGESCAAQPGECQDAKGNGFINLR